MLHAEAKAEFLINWEFSILQARYGLDKSSKGLFWLLSQLLAILVLQLSFLPLVPQHFTHLCPLCPMFTVVAGVGKARSHSQEWERVPKSSQTQRLGGAKDDSHKR